MHTQSNGSPARALALALFFLTIFVVQGVFFIRANSATYDAPLDVATGYSYLALRQFRIGIENPPLVQEILALPAFLVYRLPFAPDPRKLQAADAFAIGNDFLFGSTTP